MRDYAYFLENRLRQRYRLEGVPLVDRLRRPGSGRRRPRIPGRARDAGSRRRYAVKRLLAIRGSLAIAGRRAGGRARLRRARLRGGARPPGHGRPARAARTRSLYLHPRWPTATRQWSGRERRWTSCPRCPSSATGCCDPAAARLGTGHASSATSRGLARRRGGARAAARAPARTLADPPEGRRPPRAAESVAGSAVRIRSPRRPIAATPAMRPARERRRGLTGRLRLAVERVRRTSARRSTRPGTGSVARRRTDATRARDGAAARRARHRLRRAGARGAPAATGARCLGRPAPSGLPAAPVGGCRIGRAAAFLRAPAGAGRSAAGRSSRAAST